MGTSFWDKFTNQRISRRRALQMAAVGGASAGAIAIVGCSSSSSSDKTPTAGKSPGAGTTSAPSEGTPKPGGTLHGTVSLVLGKDPMKASSFLTHALASYSYSRLMRFKTTLGELPQSDWYMPEPEVAAKVENPDPTTYIFTLRPDVKFHNVPPVNGRKLGAKDVVYSFNRFMSVSPNKADLNMVDSVTASADDTQVTFKLKQPFGLFLNRIASFQDLWIMPQEFIESSEKAADDSMLGSGPFLFDKYVAGSVIAWKKNPDYFEKDANGTPLPYLDAVNLAIITDQNQVLSQFAAGALDSISVPPKLVESVKSQNPNAIIDQAPRNILSFLYFDPLAYTQDKMPFKDERVRIAMSHAIERDGLLQLISKAGGVWPNMPIDGGFGSEWWLDPKSSDMGDAGNNYKYDVAEAKSLLSAAGVATFEAPMHYSLDTYTTIVPYYDIVRQALPAMFKDIGVTVKDAGEAYGNYIGTTFTGKFDGFAFGLESVFSDIAAYWENMFFPRDAGGGRNHSSVNDATLVDNIKKMVQASSVDDIKKQNFELQKYTSAHMYYVPVVTPVEYGARTPKLKGVQNTTGPTTYANGTEVALKLWFAS